MTVIRTFEAFRSGLDVLDLPYYRYSVQSSGF